MKEIEERRSIRKYQKKEIPAAFLDQLIEAASSAPSSKNRQPWKFLIMRETCKEKVLQIMKQGLDREKQHPLLPGSAFGIPDAENTIRIMTEAPCLIFIMNPDGYSPFEFLNPDQRFHEINDLLSIGAAIENLLLEAASLGLGTLWIGNTCFAYPELMKVLGEQGQLIGAVALGYPDESPNRRPRKKREEILRIL